MKMEKFSKEELESEKWKDVDGYDGMYQVSDLGRVRSKYSGEWKVMKGGTLPKGYLKVDLHRDGKGKSVTVHRLVANAFIPNDDESRTQINHINEIKTDNRVENLEWCTASYNQTYNDLNLRKKNGKRRKIAKLFNPDITNKQNLELFRLNGIKCSVETVRQLRKDLGLKTSRPKYVLKEIKDLYRPDLSYQENIKLFRANNIECCKATLYKLRKELGLAKKYKK